MKRLFALLLISFAALSCEMIDEKIDDQLDKRDWVVFAEGTELSVDVPSKQTVLNYKFESTLDWEVATDAEWLEIDPMSGKAGKDIKIQIKVLHNKDKVGRTGYADLTLSNDESYRITINQAGENDENDENDEGDENDENDVDIPNNQIWYTSTDGKIVEPYCGEDNNYADAFTTFGVNIVSNTYVDGKGIIEFDGDVTIIGDYAFLYCSNLTSVTIGDSVTEIGYCSFYDCTCLESVTIGNGVTTIGHAAFGWCENLEAVHITDLVSWCNIDFINLSTDGRVEFSANPLGYAHNLYLNGELVTDLVIPDGVNEIKLMAFALCESIKSVTIPNSVTTIGDYAFYNCTSLTSVTIGDSVTEIGYCTFYNCGSLTSVTIPDSVTTIGDGAFMDCYSLTSVTIGDSVTEIGGGAFRNCSSLTSVTIPDSVITIGDCTFYDCSSLTSVTIGDSVTTIGHGAFYNCTSLTSITIPDSVTTIGVWAFYNCSSLTSVTIPDSVTTIGHAAFGGCENLEAVHITDLVSWCNIDFINPFTDGRVDFSANPLCYAKNLYLNGELVTDLVIPDGVNEIKLMAFALCESIKSVTIPDSVTTIGKDAFYECRSLTSVTIGDSVTTIGDYAFLYCSSLTSVTIGDSVTTIGHGAFGGCENLEAVHITDLVSWCNIDFINPFTDGRVDFSANPLCYAKNLYLNGELVTDLVIPDGVNEIKLMAFTSCDSITSVTIPDSVTTIGDYAFSSCTSLTSVTIGNGVTRIGEAAFYNCSSLTSVTIPDSVTTIEDYAFYRCESLTSVYCKATTPPALGGTSVFDNNGSGRKIYVPMESVEAYKSAEGWSEYADRIITKDAPTSIIRYTTIDGKPITTPNMAVKSNTYINGEGVLEFYGNTIQHNAFSGCSNLTSVTIPEGVTTIGSSAFSGCSSLTCVTIPDSVTSIGDSAFSNCSSLTSVTIPDSVTTIGSSAFYGCSSLTSITIPDSVTTIGLWAFGRCGLTSVYCKPTTPPAAFFYEEGWYAFYDNYPDRKIYVPMESVEAYKSAEGWSEYASSIVGYNF